MQLNISRSYSFSFISRWAWNFFRQKC